MNSRSVCIILVLLALVCVMGLSESSAQRTRRNNPQAAPANSPTPPTATSPTPTPTPTPPEKILKDLKETINGFGQGALLTGQERTRNFEFSDACKYGCKGCILWWDFQVSAAMLELFKVRVALSAINPKEISVDGTQVEFKTNNGHTIAVTTCKPAVTDKCDPKQIDYTDAWQLSIRNDGGAERVASLLQQVLNESCPKP